MPVRPVRRCVCGCRCRSVDQQVGTFNMLISKSRRKKAKKREKGVGMSYRSSEQLNAIFEGKTLLWNEVSGWNKSQVLVCHCADACADARVRMNERRASGQVGFTWIQGKRGQKTRETIRMNNISSKRLDAIFEGKTLLWDEVSEQNKRTGGGTQEMKEREVT